MSLILIICSIKSVNLIIYFLPLHWTHYMPPSLYTPVFLCPTALTSTPTELMLSPSCANHSIPQCPKALHSIPTEPPAEPHKLLPVVFGLVASYPRFMEGHFQCPCSQPSPLPWHLFSFLWKYIFSYTGWAGRMGEKVCGSPSPWHPTPYSLSLQPPLLISDWKTKRKEKWQ